MEDDQQFCLRWNNHQSTLISVFDTLLENQTLVDCTLAAEGKFLKAHKVVLSACSPFFATLLQQQYDKHPIFILKDVKYQELRAMMDYMYRGEVNISQDQLAALLKAAESLQIKGLSDNRSGNTQKSEQHRGLNVPGSGNSGGKLSGYTLEQTQTKRPRVGPSMETTDLSASREGSSSPSRRRRKVRRRSVENAMPADVHDNSSSSQMNQSTIQPQQQHQQSQQSAANLTGIGALTAATSSLPAPAPVLPTGSSGVLGATGSIVSTQGTTQQMTPSITKKTESVKGISDAINTEAIQAVGGVVGAGDEQNLDNLKGEKSNHKQRSSAAGIVAKETTEMVIEPKSEYEEEGNEETVEDLTLDDEEMAMEDLDQNAGTSQAGEGSSQGYAPWQHDRSQDELLLAPQEAQQRDPQDFRALYNIATAAAAVVAAASTTNAAHIHNDSSKAMTISNEQSKCIIVDQIDGNFNNYDKSNIISNPIQSNVMLANFTLDNDPFTSDGSSTAQTSSYMSITKSKNKNILCDALEPEISIQTMYKCCRKSCMSQQQNQQHHLQMLQPHNITNTNTTTKTTSRLSPLKVAVTTTSTATAATTPPTIGTTTILEHVSNSLPISSTTTSLHSNCSGCQISAATSIQLANLINSSMLIPQQQSVETANIQDNSSKMPGTLINVTTDHNSFTNIAKNSEKILISGGNKANDNCKSVTQHPTHSRKVSPNLSIATKKSILLQFKCEFCTFSCSWKYDLKLHLRQKHGIHNKKM